VLAVFAAISVWVIALYLWQVVVHGRNWTGTDGLYLVDQLQYLAWIRDASHHVLVSNLFVLRPTPADFFQPAIVASGALTALGVPVWLSLLLWKPVAVVGLFLAIRRYIARTVADRMAARAALVLALFYGSFTVVYGSAEPIGDLFLGFLSWGYVFSLLALACMVAALLSHDRLRSAGRVGWLPGAFGATASILHPWHGELLILTVIGAEAMSLRRGSLRRRLGLPAITVLMTAAPLLYYELLARLDLSWKLARVASKHAFPLTWILLYLLPILLPALVVYVRRARPASFIEASTRAWPVAALLVYAVSATSVQATPLHAFQGITIPLSILAVQGLELLGFSRIPHHRLVGAALVVLFTVPATLDEMRTARELAVPLASSASFVTPGEQRALSYLAHDPEPGGVMTRSYLGALVPGATGRHTLVGDCLWSEPNCVQRLVTVRSLFTGKMSATAARAFVRASGARFLLADCRPTTNVGRLLRPLITSVHTFGCARVYRVQ
jgi:hypothetical protein